MSFYLSPEIREEIMFWWFMFAVNIVNPYVFRCVFFNVLDGFNIKYPEKMKRNSTWLFIGIIMCINAHLYALSILWQYLQ